MAVQGAFVERGLARFQVCQLAEDSDDVRQDEGLTNTFGLT
jgi:hypothetical protein